VTSDLSRRSGGWAVIVLVAAALSLGACGRKGPLDLPPNASSASTANLQRPLTDTAAEEAAKPGLFNPNYYTSAAPVATKGPKRPFALDPLLGN